MTRDAQLTYCRVTEQVDGTRVTFLDGAWSFIGNNADEVRLAAAEGIGLKHDIPTYNYEHEFLHAFLAEKMWQAASPVLWNSAHHRKGNIVASYYEEDCVHRFHCYLRGTVDLPDPLWPWEAWREEARKLLGSPSTSVELLSVCS